MVHAYAVIKDEALSLPERIALVDFFEVLEDATFEVVDGFKPLFE